MCVLVVVNGSGGGGGGWVGGSEKLFCPGLRSAIVVSRGRK